ncbi:hypothetical protein AMAG_08100 [Allomyces macrogynus ATCC 38327]|uniref:Uncharacterized protein n=1 Tax=Allomyces macrogynus (strain ATCC 38327) TaxID=578462 RepID=A0A0L0SK96_ALLM3|nr:hypothetical protein AMAG_08100 [Allomyces macrogynus ATCC 38327]|eukprot:KNE62922.1 hypothetical protein AMAG_08100 [Allomyces macrogynus ATCC 38327]
MTDRFANFGRRARKSLLGDNGGPDSPAGTSGASDQQSSSVTRSAFPTAPSSRFAQENTDALEETVLSEAPASGSGSATASGPGGSLTDLTVQDGPKRTRKRNGQANGWYNVRTVDADPAPGSKKTGSAASINSGGSSKPDQLDQVESALEQAASTSTLRSQSSANRSSLGRSSGSDMFSSASSLVINVGRQVLDVLEEPDENDVDASRDPLFDDSMDFGSASWSDGSLARSGSLLATAGGSMARGGSGAKKEAIDLAVLASAALVGRAAVMRETDTVWTWSSLMTELGAAGLGTSNSASS